jgi:hypothetical protein
VVATEATGESNFAKSFILENNLTRAKFWANKRAHKGRVNRVGESINYQSFNLLWRDSAKAGFF